MNKEYKSWLVHESSTYSYLGRNDACVNWVLSNRKQKKLPYPKTIVLIGSGIIEPFTIAAIPLALRSQIIAVEINPELIKIVQTIKEGKRISWADIAKKTQHPGVINTQLTDPENLSKGIKKLAKLGSLVNLGQNFDADTIHVADSVRNRVTFIHADALSAFDTIFDADIICDFFVQVNVNKDQEKGIDYTRKMIKASISALAPDGDYMIGDSGRNMPITLSHIGEAFESKLKVSALTHVINESEKYSSSYYSVLGRRSTGLTLARHTMQKNISNIAKKFKLPITEQAITVNQLAQISADYVFFGYIGNNSGIDGRVWYSSLSQEETLNKLSPSRNRVFSDNIIFPK